MEHLKLESPLQSAADINRFVAKYGLSYNGSAEALDRLHRIAIMEKLNPNFVPECSPPNDPSTEIIRNKYVALLYKHAKCFAVSLRDLAEPARAPPFRVVTFGEPTFTPPIRLPPTHLDFLRNEIAESKAGNIIQSGTSAWSAGCFVVPKPRSTKLRLVIDYRRLNAQTIRDSYPIPHIWDIIRRIGHYSIYHKLDLKSGFWQIQVATDSIDKLAFSTPDELLLWLRCPMGVRNGPPHF